MSLKSGKEGFSTIEVVYVGAGAIPLDTLEVRFPPVPQGENTDTYSKASTSHTFLWPSP